MKKGVIYTCLTGNYDYLEDHSYVNNDWDYICFTDNPYIKRKYYSNWKIKELSFSKLDDTRNQRWHKMHPHIILPEYKMSLYIDANIEILNNKIFQDINRILEKKEKISISPHPERNCIYSEYRACKLLDKDDNRIMKMQIDIFKKEKYPLKQGLFETAILFREHNDTQVKEIMKDWWWWVKNYSKRDQLSLNYVLWKHKIRVSKLTRVTYRNGDGRIRYWPHINDFKNYIRASESNTCRILENCEKANMEIKTLKNEINIIRKENESLAYILENIKSSKFFKTWQIFNKMKKTIQL